jgi:predicted flavoprotein YhiN
MKNLFVITIAIAAIGGTSTNKAGACNLNLPTFELMGFPISPHQVAVMGSAHVEESSAAPKLELAGMPASPHQIAVLAPRTKALKMVQATVGIPGPTTVGLTPLGSPARATDAGLCTAD